jgi:hypothetical protein
VLQSAGGHHVRLLDSTLNGHVNIAAESGNVQYFVVDRVWQGAAGATGASYYVTFYAMDATNTFGSGAPEGTRMGAVHFYKGYGNGTEHPDGGTQIFRDDASAGAGGSHTWHAVVTDYGGHTASITNGSVAVPSNVTVNPASGFTTSGLASFLTSPDVPHERFKASYSLANDLFQVLDDFDIVLD